jgi:hypothetical protein
MVDSFSQVLVKSQTADTNSTAVGSEEMSIMWDELSPSGRGLEA